MQLEDWLDDLCVRFIINLPPEELESVERICFQVEEAQWFYEDFIRPLDPSLPSLALRPFSLRIFQHCPLFSQWSAENYTAAFAEFMAYKSRVPVRGAIMLNEEMNKVVLVKGWKKGANWSFPRGKINKDEADLDCAVREVYEETGFDIRAAGLVPEEKDTKYIEITMREQHMRLYVFRGVPMDTHFEPRTRKEISKIEWYKLTDLPTIKKQKNQDSTTENLAINANKFYMVAPFLNPLKKWIAQQRKHEPRQTFPALLLPPVPAEDTVTEDETDALVRPPLQTAGHAHSLSTGPSDLPEVTGSRPQVPRPAGHVPLGPTPDPDASAHLKQLLNIGGPPQAPQQLPPRRVTPLANNAAKSSALLSLLRSGSTAELRAMPNTPAEEMSFPPGIPQAPQYQPFQPMPVATMQSPPQFSVQPDMDMIRPSFDQQSMPDARSRPTELPHREHRPMPPPGFERVSGVPGPSMQPIPPYQKTGDPQFAPQMRDDRQGSAIPPANTLPKLTNHTKSLLDVFKAGPIGQAQSQVSTSSHQPALMTTASAGSNYAASPEPARTTTHPAGVIRPPQVDRPLETAVKAATPGTTILLPKSGHQANLLDLFRQPSGPVKIGPSHLPATTSSQPIELAATSAREDPSTPNDLLNRLLKQDKPVKKERPLSSQGAEKSKRQSGPREGETSATLSGPLNQPQFDSMSRVIRHTTNGHSRSPVANPTLFDPNQPGPKSATPIKILARPDDARKSPARSPRTTKATPAASSPRRTHAPREPKELSKPFQPQILKRPQTADSDRGHISDSAGSMLPQTPERAPQTILKRPEEPSAEPSAIGVLPNIPPERKPSQIDSHRQTLLSLFTVSSPQHPAPAVPQRRSSPASAVGPVAAEPADNLQPISTRSRVGSMASNVDGTSRRPPVEKRHTAAKDKDFLLGYLGRIANQGS